MGRAGGQGLPPTGPRRNQHGHDMWPWTLAGWVKARPSGSSTYAGGDRHRKQY